MSDSTDIMDKNVHKIKKFSSVLEKVNETIKNMSTTMNSTINSNERSAEGHVATSEKVQSIIIYMEKIETVSQENTQSIFKLKEATESLMQISENLNRKLSQFVV